MSPATLALALVLSATSASRLGLVVEGDDATARTLLAACPRLVVFPLPPSAAAPAQLAAYRAACPDGTVVAQVGGVGQRVDAANVYTQWSTEWQPQVQSLGGKVDGVEGPWDADASGAGLVAFWSTFAQVVSLFDQVPVVNASAAALRAPVAGADGGTEDGFCPVARAVRAAASTWAWSWRGLSPTLAQDATTEAATTLGYRAIAAECGLGGVPLYLTSVRPSARPWQVGDVAWLAWLDGQLAADAQPLDLRGGALEEAGLPVTFDLTPVADGLAAQLQHPQPADGGSPDGGPADAGGGTGIVQPTPVPGGTLVAPPKGCSCGSPVLGLLAVAGTALARLRRRGGGRSSR